LIYDSGRKPETITVTRTQPPPKDESTDVPKTNSAPGRKLSATIWVAF